MNADKIYELFSEINKTSDIAKIKCLSEYGMSLFDNNNEHFIKCSKDPIYFIENYLTLSNPNGKIKFKLHEYQKRYVKFIFSDDQSGASKYVKNTRQSGMTSVNCAIFAWRFLFELDKSLLYVTSSRTSMKHARNVVGDFINQFISKFDYLYGKSFITDNNKETIRNDLGTMIIFVAQGFACNGGIRGRKISHAYLDDVEFYENFSEIMQCLYPSFYGKSLNNLILSSCKRQGVRKNVLASSQVFEVNCLDIPSRDASWIVHVIKNIGVDQFEIEYMP
jgi:hypothetical protein